MNNSLSRTWNSIFHIWLRGKTHSHAHHSLRNVKGGTFKSFISLHTVTPLSLSSHHHHIDKLNFRVQTLSIPRWTRNLIWNKNIVEKSGNSRCFMFDRCCSAPAAHRHSAFPKAHFVGITEANSERALESQQVCCSGEEEEKFSVAQESEKSAHLTRRERGKMKTKKSR